MKTDIRVMRTYHLSGRLVQVPVAVREVVDPRAHEVPREEHGHVVRAHARQRLLEHLEAPVLPLGRRRRSEQRLCGQPHTHRPLVSPKRVECRTGKATNRRRRSGKTLGRTPSRHGGAPAPRGRAAGPGRAGRPRRSGPGASTIQLSEGPSPRLRPRRPPGCG